MEESLNSDDIVDIGEEHHKAGRLQEAESCYRRALEIDPGHPGALYFLANIAYDDGRLPLAAQLIDVLLRDEPNDAEAWHLMGLVARKEEDFPRAVECLKKAVALQPAYVQAHYNLGDVLGGQGDVEGALAGFQQAALLNPHFADAHLAVGNAYAVQNKLNQAIVSYRQALNAKPDFELAYLNSAQILRSQGKLDEAIAVYRQALVKLPEAAAVHLNLGIVLIECKKFADAVESLKRAVLLDSDCADAHANLGIVLLEQGDMSGALTAFKRLVELTPKNPYSQNYLAGAYNRMGKVAEAIGCWQKAIALDQNFAPPHQFILSFSQYLPGYSLEQMFADHVAFGERFEAPWRDKWPEHKKPEDSVKRLRVGFVSGDLYGHPVGYFIEGVLRELRRLDGIDIIVYAMNTLEDAVTYRLRAAAHEWSLVARMSDDVFEARIREDSIDILVDLSGHTAGNRLLVFARKPAPIEVTWLGYWQTTGLLAIDYILCDRYSVRDEEANFFVERPWYIPNTRLCFTLPDESVAVAPLPALSKGYVTFGCFNNLLKMSDRAVAIWSRILKRVPNARLFLKWPSLFEASIRTEVGARFAAEGISANRLEFEAATPLREYFLAYNRVDIALDPFPFPGGTTSVQGIWMGVPMITLRGDRIISRQGENILHNLDMDDWIAEDEEAYVELAVRHANDLMNLSNLRGQLREKLAASPLCNTELFAKNLERAFNGMWKKYCDNHN